MSTKSALQHRSIHEFWGVDRPTERTTSHTPVRKNSSRLIKTSSNHPDNFGVTAPHIVPSPRHTSLRPAAAGLRTLSIIVLLVVAVGAFSRPTRASAVANDDWLGILNTYRAMSGLNPVVENPTWSAQGQAHGCYMLQNGISHDEVPGLPGYTPGGDLAGNNGNVAVSSSTGATARNHIDLWMTGPFHAIGLLRDNLTSTGYGDCTSASTPTPWGAGATIDVLRGLDPAKPAPTEPIVFPGNGATIPLNRFVTEYPNPLTLCGWTGSAGLPLIAMMPNPVNTSNATLTGPDGPIPTCVLDRSNTGADATAQAILGNDNAVVVVPRTVLANGDYSVTVNTDAGTASWTFKVDTNAPLAVGPPEVPDTEPATPAARFESVAPFRKVDTRQGDGAVRLQAGKTTRVNIVSGRTDVTAVSANFVAIDPTATGYLTLYNCTTNVPTVSTLGYGPGDAIANQAIVPLQDGDICVYSKAAVDVVIDVNGYYSTTAGSGFVPVSPRRLYDSRNPGQIALAANTERELVVAGVAPGAPADATAVALNATVVGPTQPGYLQVYPCGSPSASNISTVNYQPGDIKPNTVVTPVTDTGSICVRSLTATDVVIDLLGYFDDTAGFEFEALDPVRLFDSRSPYAELNTATAGQRLRGGQTIRLKIAGARGIATDAQAVSINLTMTDSPTGSYVTAFPCDSRPDTSNANLVPWDVVSATGAMVKLSPEGDLCLYAGYDTHVVIDINGVWR